MSVHFTKEGLVDDQGFSVEISYAQLSKACLQETYSTIRIREIILAAVEEVLGQKIIVNNYCNSSELFTRLEQEIQNHPAYQATKKEIRRKADMNKDKSPKIDTRSRTAERSARRLLIERKRRKLY